VGASSDPTLVNPDNAGGGKGPDFWVLSTERAMGGLA